jgi:hypothetical protein
MLSCEGNVIIWIKCYCLEQLLSCGSLSYHVGGNGILWDRMLSSGVIVIMWDQIISSGYNVIMWRKCYYVEAPLNHSAQAAPSPSCMPREPAPTAELPASTCCRRPLQLFPALPVVLPAPACCRTDLKVHKREKFFGSDFEFFTIL